LLALRRRALPPQNLYQDLIRMKRSNKLKTVRVAIAAPTPDIADTAIPFTVKR
jgi:hypothetical protein